MGGRSFLPIYSAFEILIEGLRSWVPGLIPALERDERTGALLVQASRPVPQCGHTFITHA